MNQPLGNTINGIGPGKYDPECTAARESCKADGVLLMVINGDRGEGFSVQATPDVIMNTPRILRYVADQIEAMQQQARRS